MATHYVYQQHLFDPIESQQGFATYHNTDTTAANASHEYHHLQRVLFQHHPQSLSSPYDAYPAQSYPNHDYPVTYSNPASSDTQFESQYCNYSCCGLTLSNMHELTVHNEQVHGTSIAPQLDYQHHQTLPHLSTSVPTEQYAASSGPPSPESAYEPITPVDGHCLGLPYAHPGIYADQESGLPQHVYSAPLESIKYRDTTESSLDGWDAVPPRDPAPELTIQASQRMAVMAPEVMPMLPYHLQQPLVVSSSPVVSNSMESTMVHAPVTSIPSESHALAPYNASRRLAVSIPSRDETPPPITSVNPQALLPPRSFAASVSEFQAQPQEAIACNLNPAVVPAETVMTPHSPSQHVSPPPASMTPTSIASADSPARSAAAAETASLSSLPAKKMAGRSKSKQPQQQQGRKSKKSIKARASDSALSKKLSHYIGLDRNSPPEDKPHKCPHEGCKKAYLNPNGLTYHLRKGTCEF